MSKGLNPGLSEAENQKILPETIFTQKKKKKLGMHTALFSCKTSLQTHVDHCILSMYASSLIFQFNRQLRN